MREELSDLARFKHIRDAAEKLIGFVDGITTEEFHASNLHKYAVERCIMKIGESASKISKESLLNTNYTEWKQTIGIRGKLVNDYNFVDYTIVYLVATEDI